MRVALLAVIVIALLVGGRPAEALRHPSAPRCSIFPKSNVWNQRVDRLPVAANSDAIIRSIGPDETLHPDFGSGLWEGAPIGIPITVVRGRQAKTRLRFEYADESDRGPYPIPRNVKIEGGRQSNGDRHALILDRDNCRLYELFALYPERNGWRAGSGAIWNLRTNRLRPAGWTSADAAGLPILPGLARYEEVRRGRIRHALRFTVFETRRAFVFPARHFASSLTDRALPRMGERLRLRGDYDISRLPRQARVIARALKEYGMLVADNGSDWYVSGAPHRGWDNDALHELGRIRGADFEVVQTG